MGVYLSLSKSYVEKTLQKANERAIKELGEEDGKDTLRWDFDEDCSIEIDQDRNEIRLNSEQASIGYISLQGEPSIDEQIEIVELVVKRMNKFKNLLESLK